MHDNKIANLLNIIYVYIYKVVISVWVYVCSTCECSLDQKSRVDTRFIKHRQSTMQGGEDYRVNNLYLVDQEMKKLFTEDR